MRTSHSLVTSPFQLHPWTPSPWRRRHHTPQATCKGSTLSPGPWVTMVAKCQGHRPLARSAFCLLWNGSKKIKHQRGKFISKIRPLPELLWTFRKNTCFVKKFRFFFLNQLLFITSAEVELNHFFKTKHEILDVGHYYWLAAVSIHQDQYWRDDTILSQFSPL